MNAGILSPFANGYGLQKFGLAAHEKGLEVATEEKSDIMSVEEIQAIIDATSKAAADEKLEVIPDTVVGDGADSVMEDAPPVDEQGETPFPWDRLANELKDSIYDHVRGETQTIALKAPACDDKELEHLEGPERPDLVVDDPPDSTSTRQLYPRAVVRNKPNVNLLRVNKETKEAYQARADKQVELVIIDHDQYTFNRFSLPSYATIIQTLELHLILFCHVCAGATHLNQYGCHAVAECGRHLKWIEHLLTQMSLLRHFSVFVHICYDRFTLGGKDRTPCEKFVLPMLQGLQEREPLKHLVVYQCEFSKLQAQSLDGPKDMLYEWENGEVKMIKEPEKEEEEEEDDEEEEEVAGPSSSDNEPMEDESQDPRANL